MGSEQRIQMALGGIVRHGTPLQRRGHVRPEVCGGGAEDRWPRHPPEPGVLPVGRIDSVERPDGEASDGAFPLLARTESGVPTNLPQFLSYLLLQIVLHADGHDGLGESAVERSVKAMTEVLPMRHIHVVLKHGPAKRRTRART